MNPLAIAKTATGLVVSMGAGAVISNAIKASIPANSKVIQKVTIGIGGFVLSSMVGEMATQYVNKNIDAGIQQFQDAKAAMNQTTSEASTEA
jgi:hypothetical protein